MDEVGRGAWAGPVVVAAVLLGGEPVSGLTDSKKLTKKQRERLDLEIRQKAGAIGIGWVSARQIDRIGLSQALKLAARRALAQVRVDYREIIIDGTVALIEDRLVTVMAKADLLVPSVSAASIVAKVARDNYMKHLDSIFPGYKFGSHVGYGTAAHQAALEELGTTPLHRLSFAPLRQYTDSGTRKAFSPAGDVNSPILSNRETSKQVGSAGEDAAARYLRQQGHTVINRNWRTKFCEIDIVSCRGNTIYFTEVKYRKNDRQGGGLAAITQKKLRQMRFAAEYYLHAYRLEHRDACLAAANVTGTPPKVCDFLELG